MQSDAIIFPEIFNTYQNTRINSRATNLKNIISTSQVCNSSNSQRKSFQPQEALGKLNSTISDQSGKFYDMRNNLVSSQRKSLKPDSSQSKEPWLRYQKTQKGRNIGNNLQSEFDDDLVVNKVSKEYFDLLAKTFNLESQM